MVLLQPCLTILVALSASALHFWALPAASFTSKKITEWGFINWKSVIVPFKVVCVVISYSAGPWCAETGAEGTKSRAARVRRHNGQIFMGALQCVKFSHWPHDLSMRKKCQFRKTRIVEVQDSRLWPHGPNWDSRRALYYSTSPTGRKRPRPESYVVTAPRAM